MGKINSAYESLVRGVSNQPRELRLPGQHGEQVNMTADPVEGLGRRQGTVRVRDNLLPSTAGLLSDLARQYNEQDIKIEEQSLTLLTRRPGTSGVGQHVYAVRRGGANDGQLLPVVASTAANAQLASGVNSLCAAGRYIIMAHNNPTVGTETAAWSASGTVSHANIFVRGGSYSKTYSVTIKVVGQAAITVSYTTPTSSYPNALDTTDIPYGAADYTKRVNDRVNAYNAAVTAWIGTANAAVQPQAIAFTLLTQLNAAANFSTFFNSTIKGAVIGIQTKPGYDIEYITVDDGGDGSQLKRLWKEVDDPADLPPVTWSNFVIKVSPTGKDAYYMRSSGGEDFSKVKWTESFGTGYTITNIFVLGVIHNNTLYLGATPADLQAALPGGSGITVPTIDDRLVGDDESSPVPHFANKRVTYVGMFQDRLVLAAENVVTCSAVGGYFTFWRSTVLSEIDSDPVEIFANGSEGDVIRQAAFFDRSIVFFGDSQQYAISGKVPLTPATATMMQSSAHKDAATCRPLAHGDFVFYTKTDKDAAFARLYQVSVGQADDTSNSSDIGQQLSTYIKGRARALIGVSMPDTVVVRTDANFNGLYLFRYVDNPGGERVLDQWGRWEFAPECGEVVAVSAYQDRLRIMFARAFNGGQYLVVDEATLTPSDNTKPHLDSRTLLTARPGATGTTHPGLAVAWGSDTLDTRAWEGEASVDDLPELTAEVGIDSAIYAGYNFDSYVDLTSPVLRDSNDVAVTRGRLVINNLRIRHRATVGYDVRLISDYEDEVVLEFRARTINDSNYLFGTLTPQAGEEVAPLDREASEYTARVQSHLWLPMTIYAIDWDGQTFNNTRRI